MTYTFISWNIDSINAALTGTSPRSALSMKTLKDISQLSPDILAIQETKLRAEGPTTKHLNIIQSLFSDYELAFNSSIEPARKGYSGTLFLYKKTLSPKISYPQISAPGTMDFEGRIITLEFSNFFVSQVYTPNAGEGLKRLKDRGLWDDYYRGYLQDLEKIKPVLACGDFNVAHQEIDLANPASNHQSPGFTDQEREKFSSLLSSGFVDSFRLLHPELKSTYSWFSQRSKTAKTNNTGWRIDYWLVSEQLSDKIIQSEMIDTGTRPDHLPILLKINL